MQPFYARNFTPIPDLLLRELDRVSSKCFMGIFSDISRAWMSIDHRLYLWDYTVSVTKELTVYEDLPETILTVALVKPAAGTTADSSAWFVAVSMADEVTLLSLTNPTQQLWELNRTSLSISTDNVPMMSLLGTKEGRLFMGGHDGNLYEFTYQVALFGLLVTAMCHSSFTLAGGRLVYPSLRSY